MQIAIDCAGFPPAKADKLRRAMATFRRAGTIHKLKDDFINGMVGNGYEREFAERCFKQIEGFGEYGFPESHAASFAILVYDLVLGEALLPRGLRRRPAQLPADGLLCAGPARARCAASTTSRCGRPTSMPATGTARWRPRPADNRCALRLGLRQVTGLSEDDVKRMVERRTEPYRDPADLWRRCGLNKRQILALARADAFASLGLSRRDVLWAVRAFSEAVAAAARRAAAGARPRTAVSPAHAHARRAGGRRLLDRSRCRCAPIRWRCCGRRCHRARRVIRPKC